ncbi:hypothetical protein LX36DRAFT_736679 [Colletotrichum falcatum]|nr:hypothetical protein LX36DRAFT_736679 [Colletotrichum falcatum]
MLLITKEQGAATSDGTSFFNKPDHSDVQILIGKHNLPAHRLVLDCQSGYFSKALQLAFKEGTTNKFEFTEGSHHAYWRAFEFMYTGTYSEDPSTELEDEGEAIVLVLCQETNCFVDDDEMTKDIRVYALAEYFQVECLKKYSLDKLVSKLETLWNCEGFIDCIRETYCSTTETDEEPRRLVARTAHKRLSYLWKKKPFRDLVHEGGGSQLI